MLISKMPDGSPEVYKAFQGEGATMGELCVFVRLAGCSLRCTFCLIGGTKVLLPNGKTEEIKRLKVGDKVMSYNEKTKKIEEDEVTEIMDRITFEEEVLDIELEDGVKMSITKNHEVMTDRGWVKAGDLNEEDKLVFAN